MSFRLLPLINLFVVRADACPMISPWINGEFSCESVAQADAKVLLAQGLDCIVLIASS